MAEWEQWGLAESGLGFIPGTDAVVARGCEELQGVTKSARKPSLHLGCHTCKFNNTPTSVPNRVYFAVL